MAAAINTKAVSPIITKPTFVPLIAGEILKIMNGAIFTIVEEWSNALTGVGATIAPISHLLKGY